ncbi:MAG: PAS domain-containing protein [Chloroflexi bacterium]|nr:PAS domain-containing protein [Chloroflexota bacterium]
MLYLFDVAQQRIVYANRSFQTLFGYSVDELPQPLPADYLAQVMHPDDYALEQSYGNRYATIQDDEVIETEYRWMMKDKQLVWRNVREMAFERGKDGAVTQIMGISRDVTDRRAAEEQRQKMLTQLQAANQDLKDFAYIISHDLRAPLRGVSSVATWLLSRHSEQLDEEGGTLVKLLMGRVRRMEQMIDGVLEYSRIGRESERRIPVDVNRLVSELVQDIVPAEGFRVTIENPLPTLTINAVRIRQVFQNLIDNAVKFMDKPLGEIHIGCAQMADVWQFYVRDNGSGIAPEHYERIFQLFQTLIPKDQVESTGVGLALAKRIVEHANGRLWLESVVGTGTTFYFTLPASMDRENA